MANEKYFRTSGDFDLTRHVTGGWKKSRETSRLIIYIYFFFTMGAASAENTLLDPFGSYCFPSDLDIYRGPNSKVKDKRWLMGIGKKWR
ncbi:hypothetical protein NPIL_130681 [Nephila pilipes]|uniref:Uncharacterized protein n=1 Tax=Nephila pilipes TaxID=299642 RepID=A0A8X6N1D7_NEPPI|nr:hypothetical protein NPIL_130681 [Nephila pilipes]